MKLSEFDYKLPEELIAQYPIEPRDQSRLMILDSKDETIKEDKFYSILEELTENDVLVLNKTKVINARLHGNLKDTDKLVEIFLHKQLSEKTWDCLVYPGKKLKPWKTVEFKLDNIVVLKAYIKDISDKWRVVEFDKSWVDFLSLVEKLWEIPLPPYIKQKLEKSERYQTVWAEVEWSVAAPTASLHFTPELIEKIKAKWVKIEKVLLHVWLWTFMSVETDDIKDHNMHSEYIELEKEVSDRLNTYKKEGKNIISVWTTSIRVLETFADESWILWYWNKDTNIFIYPWYKWKFVDSIITNFHLPKSTLIMLVSSFAWKDFIKKAYDYALKNKFRFFSFWDAMRIKNRK